MTPYQTITLAGATGNVGPAVLKALLAANFTVTVLVRNANPTNFPKEVKTIQVDYSSRESLTSALKGQDAFVCNLPNDVDQPLIIDACIAAGVKHYLPSEFGSAVISNDKAAALPVFAGKLAAQKYLREKTREISWTVICTSLFLDWGLEKNWILDLSGENPTAVFDGGERKVSMTTLEDIGRAVVGVLRRPEEVRDRAVYVQSTCVSQNELLGIARKRNHAFKGDVESVESETVLKESYEILESGRKEEIGKAMVGFINVSVYGEGYGSDWSEKNDNELLGIKELTEGELEELVGKYVKA